MTLTAEKIKECEARAAAGEKPRHPGWRKTDGNSPEQWGIKGLYIFVQKSSKGWFLYGLSVVELAPLTSLAAAQLAAEWLLREASAPQWEAELAALRKQVEDKDKALLLCAEALDKAASDIGQTARANQMNLTGCDPTFPGDPPTPTSVGATIIHQCGIDESLGVRRQCLAASNAAREALREGGGVG